MSSQSSWTDLPADTEYARENLQLWPLDKYNRELLDQVHPKSYIPPTSEDDDENNLPLSVDEYDLVVIGSGAGGLVSSKQSARRGVPKVALLSGHLSGGDCLNVGCVPSKALIRCARTIREVKRASEFGVNINNFDVDFGKIMERMRKLRATIAPVDSHEATEGAGVTTVFQGYGKFTSSNTVKVHGTELKFKKAIIATGGRASIPLIKGLADAPYTTNADLFNLTEMPKRMVVLGSGVIALEMAQTFSTFGTDVTVVNRSDRLFPRVDEDVHNTLYPALVEDGVKFIFGATFNEVVTTTSDGNVTIIVKGFDGEGAEFNLDCDVLLIATGRTPNIENLGLDVAGVDYSKGTGILINDVLQTSNPDIYAVGDCVANVPRLTHMSGEMAKMAVQNAIFQDSWSISSLNVPATMYTEPEYASVGQIVNKDDQYDVFDVPLEHNDRSILEGEAHPGKVKIFCEKGTDKIVGAYIIANRAGEMINEITLAMNTGAGLKEIGRTIHSYPTTGEAVMGAGLAYIRNHWETFPRNTPNKV